MKGDIPNAFVQTDIDKRRIGERIIMKICGPLVDLLVELSPETYATYVECERGSKVLYIVMQEALYGRLQIHFCATRSFEVT